MNNKGFTLIEVLAAVIILSIIMLIATPSISKVINSSKKDTFTESAKSFIKEGRTAIINGSLKAKKSSRTELVNEKCGLPPKGEYTVVDIISLSPDNKNLKSPWGYSMTKDRYSNPSGYVLVINLTNDNMGTGTKDKYVYFFAGVDKGRNGIDQFISEEEINRKKVKKGRADTNTSTNYQKNVTGPQSLKIVDGIYKNTSVGYRLFMYCTE